MKTSRLSSLVILLASLAAALSAAEQPLLIDQAHSRIEFAVKATMDSFTGQLAAYAPTVLLDAGTGKVTSAKITFHFNDVKTGNEKRDHEMHVWQQTDKFPDGDFTLAALEPSADGKFAARGSLTLHGVTHELAFPVTIKREGNALTVEGDTTVDTRLFGLPVIRKFAVVKVDPLVAVHFHLAGTTAAP